MGLSDSREERTIDGKSIKDITHERVIFEHKGKMEVLYFEPSIKIECYDVLSKLEDKFIEVMVTNGYIDFINDPSIVIIDPGSIKEIDTEKVIFEENGTFRVLYFEPSIKEKCHKIFSRPTPNSTIGTTVSNSYIIDLGMNVFSSDHDYEEV